MAIATNVQYASEKFSQAVYYLAVGEGDVRSRLRNAYQEFHTVRGDELPAELRPCFEWICHELTKRPEKFPGQGRLDATLARIRNSTGSKIAKRIYDFHEQIEGIIRDR